jgi:hypothetical protein
MDRFQQLDRKVDQICSMDQGQAFDLKVSVVINGFLLSSLMVGHVFEHINPFFSSFNTFAQWNPTNIPAMSYAVHLFYSIIFS